MKNRIPQFEPNKTVLTIVTGFLVIYFAFSLKWALIVALIIGLAGVFSTWAALQLTRGWSLLTWLISLIVPNIVLSAIFLLILYPAALLSRLFGQKDPLGLKNDKNSTFKETNKHFEPSSFEKTW